MDPNLSLLRKRRHPLRKLFLALLVLSLYLLLLLLMLVFQNSEEAIGLGMFGAVALFFLLHYLLWGRALSAEAASGIEAGRRRAPTWVCPGTDIPTDAALLLSGEKGTADGIRCAELSHHLGTSHIQRPQPPNS